MKLLVLETRVKAEATDSVAEEREGETVVPIVAFVDLVLAEKDPELLYGQLERSFLFDMGE